MRRLMPLGFLLPRIVEAIAEVRQPVELTGGRLLGESIFPCSGAPRSRRVASNNPEKVIPLWAFVRSSRRRASVTIVVS